MECWNAIAQLHALHCILAPSAAATSPVVDDNDLTRPFIRLGPSRALATTNNEQSGLLDVLSPVN